MKKTKRLTNLDKASFVLTDDLKQILVGLILGDLWLNKDKKLKNGNTSLHFEQGLVHKEYAFYLYFLFKDFCPSEPKISSGKADARTGKVYSRVRFQTYSLPCFNEYYELFYPTEKKLIPSTIDQLLTARGLSYWVADDGSKQGPGFYLNTQSFSLKEVELLIQVLNSKFDLNCSANLQGKEQYRIYIKSDSMNKFKNLVTPYLHKSMLYKLD